MMIRAGISCVIALCAVGSGMASASIMPPDCVCELTAKVLSVREQTLIHEDIRLPELLMKVQVSSMVRTVRQAMDPGSTCQKYQPGMELEFTVLRHRGLVDPQAVIMSGSSIRAQVEYSGDENGTWYNVDRIELVK